MTGDSKAAVAIYDGDRTMANSALTPTCGKVNAGGGLVLATYPGRLQGQAFMRFKDQLGLWTESVGSHKAQGDLGMSHLDGNEKGTNEEVATGRLQAIVICALAATAGVFLATGRRAVGGAVPACALTVGGRAFKKVKSEKKEGKATIDVQDGMPSVGQAAKDSTSHDDRRVSQKVTNLKGSSEVRALSVGSDGRWVPGFRAMRVESVSPRHGEATSASFHNGALNNGKAEEAKRGGCLERGAAAMSSMGYEARARLPGGGCS